ncbi:MAG: hypothetical protein A2Z99_10745 [Treponema sp. GWB1_62_6]|nr:MAG: hypothetical protein A2Z99_10745 [Treponema sp. GWB1_62_6]OHE63459.1 MAG: hypothetical protein A2001_03335 [Treponema sp. GWC1_61_84]
MTTRVLTRASHSCFRARSAPDIDGAGVEQTSEPLGFLGEADAESDPYSAKILRLRVGDQFLHTVAQHSSACVWSRVRILHLSIESFFAVRSRIAGDFRMSTGRAGFGHSVEISP